jgi:hypothetical protein
MKNGTKREPEQKKKGRLGLPKTADDQIVELGRAAWERRKQGADWEDWKAVGAALQIGRQEAMRKAQTNKPAGKAYSKAFSDWLHIHQFDDLDKSDRAKLLKIVDELEDVEAYRASLSPAERGRLNHPNSVWRAYTCPDRGKKFQQERNAEEGSEDGEQSGGRDAQERHTERWWRWVLKTENEIESDDGLAQEIVSQTGLVEKADIEPELLAALQAKTDRDALPNIRAAGERLIAAGERLVKLADVLEKVHAPPSPRAPAKVPDQKLALAARTIAGWKQPGISSSANGGSAA